MNTDLNNTPDDIRPTAESLDRLAAHDADAAPAGLEDRLFLRTAASLASSAAPTPSSTPTPAPIPLFRTTAFRLAAGIALVAAASLFFLPTSQPTTTLADEDTDLILEEIDSILAVAYEPDSEFDSLNAELSELFASDSLSDLDAWLESEEAL